ncbi:MAG: BatD family protein, partial [Myxococcota bacterium]
MVMWWLLAVAAQAAQVLLKVQPTALVEGQSGRAQVLVVSSNVGRRSLRLARVPLVQSSDGLSIGFDGQSSEFQIVNGQMTQILSFSYRVTAMETGSWNIGPVEVMLDDGTRVSTKGVTVEVKARADVDERPDVVVDTHFDVARAYEGQVVLYEFRAESRNPRASVEWIFPDFEGLREPQEGARDAREYQIDDPEGAITVSEGALPLIATSPGTRTYDPSVANVKTPIGNRRRFMLLQRVRNDPWATTPTDLTVLPLPKPPP